MNLFIQLRIKITPDERDILDCMDESVVCLCFNVQMRREKKRRQEPSDLTSDDCTNHMIPTTAHQ